MIPIPTPEERKLLRERYNKKYTLSEMIALHPENIPNIIKCIREAEKHAQQHVVNTDQLH
jgi:hypothetical protein